MNDRARNKCRPDARLIFGLGVLLAGNAAAIDVPGVGTGPIPDNNTTGINVNFNLAGLTAPVSSVELSMDLTHTFAGDLRATLRSPGGVATLVIFARTGVGLGQPNPGFGASANLGGTYRFSDDAPGDLRATAVPLAAGVVVPPGRYRTSTAGIGSTRHGGCSTWLTGAFGGLTPAQANGTWTLNIADAAAQDTGAISAAVLSVRSGDLFQDGFERRVPGTCQAARMDYTGSGRTSYVLVRNTGGGANGTITWFIRNNDGTATGTEQNFELGIATDFFLDGDFDGDGIADAAVWRSTAGQFIARRSSRPTDTLLTLDFGQSGDDPTHAGDYDGDRRDEFVVFRGGANPGDPSRTLIRFGNGTIRNLVTGENGSFASGGGDYTGDGRADIAIQSNAGGGVALLRLYDGSNGAIAASFNFGTPTDLIVLGNHTGSARHDITMSRGVGGQIEWTTRDGETAVVQPAVVLGVSATDFRVTGDYDGDGLDDYATWRPSATLGQSRFTIRRSTAPANPPLEVFFGQNGEYPVANNRVH